MTMAGNVRSWFVVSVVLVILSAVSTASGYAIEREATVELLPNDLIETGSALPEPEREETNQTVSTPQQVIKNQIMKIAETMYRTMEDTRRTLRQKNNGKRDLGSGNYLPYLLPLIACFLKLVNSGMLPESLMKGLIPLDGGSSGTLLGNTNQPLGSLLEGRQQDPLAKALGVVPADGAVADLTQGSQTHTLSGVLGSGASPAGIVGLPSSPTAGVPGMATGVATGAALGVGMTGVGALARETPLAQTPLAGGTVESVPLAASGALQQYSPFMGGFDLGYRAALAVGRLSRL